MSKEMDVGGRPVVHLEAYESALQEVNNLRAEIRQAEKEIDQWKARAEKFYRALSASDRRGRSQEQINHDSPPSRAEKELLDLLERWLRAWGTGKGDGVYLDTKDVLYGSRSDVTDANRQTIADRLQEQGFSPIPRPHAHLFCKKCNGCKYCFDGDDYKRCVCPPAVDEQERGYWMIDPELYNADKDGRVFPPTYLKPDLHHDFENDPEYIWVTVAKCGEAQ